jgi:hypothetical protein
MYQTFKKILPDSIKNGLWRGLIKLAKNKLVDNDNKIPRFTLEEKHIRNLKVITNREQLLTLMPQNGIVAELGVDKGTFSKLILQKTNARKLHLIDVWNTKRYHTGLKLDIENKFEDLIKKGIVEINFGYSTAAVSAFADNYFDWIYVDTDHTYKTTIAELELYAPKMKAGGIIAGHDFTMGNWIGMTRYGVIEAVYEFCVRYDWELLYITADIKEFPSFAIRKL